MLRLELLAFTLEFTRQPFPGPFDVIGLSISYGVTVSDGQGLS